MIRLPSRYEDLDVEFRGRLRPDAGLLAEVKRAFSSMNVSGGIRFLPVFGHSGSGKSSAALEIGTHLPELSVVSLSREAIENREALERDISKYIKKSKSGLVVVIDQYEEAVAQKANIPTNFVEILAILDRGNLRDKKILFIWLTTSKEFQKSLSDATSRNRRILANGSFEISGPAAQEWPSIISETFQFHNQDRNLADYEILDADIESIADEESSLGSAIEQVGHRLAIHNSQLHDLSNYIVIMLWPVTDGLRISRIQQFTDPRQGYKLEWSAWYRQLNAEDRKQLPLREFNRARLYFDMRLVPIAAADLHPLCRDLDHKDTKLHKTYLSRFASTHFYSIISGSWKPESYAPLRERESKRAEEATKWYESVTTQPTKIGARIARIIEALGLPSGYEKEISSVHGKIKADVLVDRSPLSPPNVIIEIKAFSAENTMPSSICSAIQTTLRRHAHFAGFLQRQ